MKKNSCGERFEKLIGIMARLRGPDGCPWDKEQTHKSLNPYLLEEAHEVMEAVDADDTKSMKEELGDLLLQIVFHSQLASEEASFDINDVINGICEKLITRHPHVFGDAKVKDSAHVLSRWEQIKKTEKKGKSVIGGVPKELPALLKAYRLGEKAGRVGFDWQNADGILAKLSEEIEELHEAKDSKDCTEMENEYGDILFTLANIGRFLKINPEDALRKSTNKFISRFQKMEKEAEESGSDIAKLNAEEWDELWKKAKEQK